MSISPSQLLEDSFQIAWEYLERTGELGDGAAASRFLSDTCACRKLNPDILVMQSAENWAAKNVPGAIDGARDRCILLQG
jgi:hypothetical protein